MVTTNVSGHGPEIDYLKDGVNGIIVEENDNPEIYAKAVARLLKDEKLRESIISHSLKDAKYYTIENMPKSSPTAS